ncbi:NAD(P)H-flavin reductase [Microbulbifer donghaiensis]|uniref:NAD(P)H-flavin reductase n=1 Tax=Microbulbifer donghaiensis TaxID=494016 RepID=A0A1M4UP40_9GAMM|nr:FAD/NAD(P)-binding protein [Microbulbifer donghaiensis]SHE58428.1 NAD(P)H-flavin reductase [Microbulbifer donghaiensis]
MTPAIYRIDSRVEEFPGTCTVRISPESAGGARRCSAGQFNMLYAFGAGEVPISMSGLQGDGSYVHTIRIQGLVTRALHRLNEGDSLGVRGPFGCGWPMDKVAGRQLLVVAGGLGMAPLRPIVQALMAGSARPASVQLFYGARRPQEMLYAAEVEQWSRALKVVTTVDHADTGWPGQIGVITKPLGAASVDIENALVFLCGPEVMMRFCIQVLLAKGVATEAIYLSMERNMKCAIGHCGHCQWGPNFVCKDGPVFCYRDIRPWFDIRAL